MGYNGRYFHPKERKEIAGRSLSCGRRTSFLASVFLLTEASATLEAGLYQA
jgi:hypothetical protein